MNALLCERCGYVLDDIDPSGICPECAVPIAASQPRLRNGSPWQQHRSFVKLIRTWFFVFFAPKRCWNQCRIEKTSALSLMGWGLIVSVLPVTLIYLTIVVYSTFQYADVETFFYAMMFIGIADSAFIVIALVYAAIAVARMKFWARHRGLRVDSQRAWTVIGHASIGLSLIPLSIFLAIASVLTSIVIEDAMSQYGIDFMMIPFIVGIIAYLLVLASIPTGLIVFEVLCSMGMRRVRYRNLHPDEKPKPAPPQHTGPPTVVT